MDWKTGESVFTSLVLTPSRCAAHILIQPATEANTAQLFFFSPSFKAPPPLFFPHRIDYYHSFLSQLLKLPFLFQIHNSVSTGERKNRSHFVSFPTNTCWNCSILCLLHSCSASCDGTEGAVCCEKAAVPGICANALPPPPAHTQTHTHRVAMPRGGCIPTALNVLPFTLWFLSLLCPSTPTPSLAFLLHCFSTAHTDAYRKTICFYCTLRHFAGKMGHNWAFNSLLEHLNSPCTVCELQLCVRQEGIGIFCAGRSHGAADLMLAVGVGRLRSIGVVVVNQEMCRCDFLEIRGRPIGWGSNQLGCRLDSACLPFHCLSLTHTDRDAVLFWES